LARRSGLFDEILTPGACLRLAAGLGAVRANCVVHLGGDLWYASRFASRAGSPAVAYVERPLIAGRHGRFAAVLTNTPQLASRLVAMGVPAAQVTAAGDLRVDALAAYGPTVSAPPADGRPHVVLLPGSRPGIFPTLSAIMLRLADAIEARLPAARVAFAVSPFVRDAMVARYLSTARPILRGDAERIAAFRGAALAIAPPGTGVVELAMLGTPTLLWLPLYDPTLIPLEGLKEWLFRAPLLGPALKTAAIRRYFANPRVLAIPNKETGRRLVEEYIGDDLEPAVADRVVAMLADAERLALMRRDLATYYRHEPGSALTVARRVLELAA